MTPLDAIVLGVVEGLTELLPISSTGHLILLGKLLGHEGEAAKVFDIVIQLGAVAAVGVYFRGRIGTTFVGLRRRERGSLQLVLALLAAFVPTAIAGLMFHRVIKQLLFAPGPVAGALIIGGLVMVVVDRWHRRKAYDKCDDEVTDITVRRGFVIGLCQCLALWPGASRSMTTIVGGQLCGLSTRTAAEFSFLLALPTLGAATVYDFIKNGHLIAATPSGVRLLLLGMTVSFVVTWLVVALFLKYVQRLGVAPFGAYRVVLGVLVMLLML